MSFLRRKRRVAVVEKLPPITAIKTRWRIYKRIRDHNHGLVPCWVCGEHVRWKHTTRPELSASLEHVLPRSKGGTNDDWNLSISHEACNLARGRRMNFAHTGDPSMPVHPAGLMPVVRGADPKTCVGGLRTPQQLPAAAGEFVAL
jgi:hypothetical protein